VSDRLQGLLDRRAIQLSATADDKDSAIRQCGQVLLDLGAVDPSYVDSMLARERSLSTFVGEGVAIPHGTLAGKDAVHHDALCFLRFPGQVDWGDGAEVSVCIGIAARDDGHVGILAELAQILLEPDRSEALRNAPDVDTVLALLQPSTEDVTT
jgi:PTS system mannitol-specific IIA component